MATVFWGLGEQLTAGTVSSIANTPVSVADVLEALFILMAPAVGTACTIFFPTVHWAPGLF